MRTTARTTTPRPPSTPAPPLLRRSRRLLAWLLAFAITPLPTTLSALIQESADQREARQEMARFQGVWWLASLEVNGKKAPDEQVRSWMLVIEADQYNPGSGETSVEYSYRIDPSRNPRAIDLIPHDGPNKGRTLRGIYSLKDDCFTICRALGSEGERPAGFHTRPESGLVMVVWKRRKP
jgi:uncharacterized protein (TIGR03067 family)